MVAICSHELYAVQFGRAEGAQDASHSLQGVQPWMLVGESTSGHARRISVAEGAGCAMAGVRSGRQASTSSGRDAFRRWSSW